ncbi:TIGR00266 family protein [Agrilactobacillus fermenti]|uniref:TIGR00266 family protein n=1 Tax=Agrilactobacillus fermenti TaxID=2586909 RepID=UPI001E2F5FEE|nr:TIGR00266 family protein [Agrilactobacillus fermenti]MCD2255739.1 TIGR00266 family protein [Agrilactobacillus fermenti]
MHYQITANQTFPVVEIYLTQNESIQIESGSMIYHNGQVALEGHMNSNGKKGMGGLLSALGRSVTSGESFFITTATGQTDQATLGIAPGNPGVIRALELEPGQQWRLNTSAYLAGDATTSYTMVRQNISGAFFGGTGGLFVMETKGYGTMLVSAYGDILEVELDGQQEYVVDNSHVVAWQESLNYNIEPASGFIGFKTGEGLVNHFSGRGKILIQTRSIEALASLVAPFLPNKDN